MTATLTYELERDRTIEERLQMLTDTDEFKELMRRYAKYSKFYHREIRENRAEIVCKEKSIEIRIIPKPFHYSYKVATMHIGSNGSFRIEMEPNTKYDQLEIDLFIQDLEKILR